MTRLKESLKNIITETTGFARIFNLKNGAVINKFKKGEVDKLSVDTLNNIGKVIGYRAEIVMVPNDMTEEQLKCFTDFDVDFIKSMNKQIEINNSAKNGKKVSELAKREPIKEKELVEKIKPIAIDINLL